MRLRPITVCCAAAALLMGWAGCGGDTAGLPVETDEPLYREGQQLEKQGRTKEALASYLRLISRRGDDAPESHLEAGLIELEEIKDPIAAIYHFRRFLELEPKSPLAPRVRDEIERARRDFASTLPAQNWETNPGGGDVDRIAQLEAENEQLKAELAALRGSAMVSAPHPAAAGAGGISPLPDAGEAAAAETTASPLVPIADNASPPAPAARMRTHVVAAHDTLYSLSRRYYGTSAKWRQILAANRDQLSGDHPDLRIGEVLKIP
ncbi:MAG TPA: LysM peptidoglycan-binding domain-containing protein [Opitutaceae bacterium]|jgi:LysM repeat protein|nr:LysM peptidoglycan-binding domain-containing protein [Opitutaceae bacterium]